MSETDFSDDMSDTGSDICEDIDELIIQSEHRRDYHSNTIETLNNIHKLIVQSANLRIITDGLQRDFNELLEELHEQSLENIRTTGEMTFGEDLKTAVEKGEFN